MVIAGDNPALRAKIGLVGGAGNKVGAFLERLLEMGADKPEDMGHVV